MKKLFSLLMVALLVGTMASCNGGTGKKKATAEDSIAAEFGKLVGLNLKQMINDPNNPEKIDEAEFLRGVETILKLDTTAKSKSFRYGLMMALQQIYPGIEQMENQGIKFDRKAFLTELKRGMKSKDSVSMEKMQQMGAAFQGMVQRAMTAKGKENDKAGQKYIKEQIKKDKGFKPLANGIYYKVLKEGKGENFNDSATVDVKYVGKHIDGKVFDDSKGEARPMNLKMGTIEGFKAVVTNMKPGEKVIALIPGAQAYGDHPQGNIGPMETLVFEVEAVGVHKEDPNAMPGMPGRPGAPGKPGPGKPAPGKPAPGPAPKPVKK